MSSATAKNIEDIKSALKEQKTILKEKYGVKSIAIFGSYSRGEQSPLSDIDLLVEFEKPIGLKFMELADYLEKILEIKVDLLTQKAIKKKPLLWTTVKEDLIYA